MKDLFLGKWRKPRLRPRLPLRVSDSTFGALASLPGLVAVLLLIVVPLIIVVSISLFRYDILHPIRFCGLNNYLRLFTDRVFLLALKNTVVFSGGSTALTFIFGFILAWFLSRISRGSTVFRTLAILPWATPLIVSGFIWGWMFNPSYGVINAVLIKLGLISQPVDIFGNLNTAMIGVIIADAWTRIPFMTILTLAGLERIPQELYEAAEIDGADVFHKLRWITLPLVRGPVLTGLLITTVFSMRTIDAIFSMTHGGPGKATYVLGFYDLDNIYRYLNFGKAGAISVTLMLLCFLTAGIYAYFLLKEKPWE